MQSLATQVDDAGPALVLVLEQAARGGCPVGAALEQRGIAHRITAEREHALRLLGRDAVALVLAQGADHAGRDGALVRQLRRVAPLVPVIVFGEVSDPDRVVAALRAGAVDYLPVDAASERIVAAVSGYLEAWRDGPVFRSPAARKSFELAGRVARTDVSVLITGESGTGKEVVARWIHQCSNRARGPFVALNCAAIPEQMMEAILFGHEKGAFTGAHQARPGKFELAEGGTLLLDEISEMGLDLQAKLLRVLQEREVERIGAESSRAVDVRVLATSNRELREEVAAGRFREDLYYRLSVFPLHLQPLRERVEDVLPLAQWFLRKHGARMGRPGVDVSEAARRLLLEHPWLGNVRELENVVQRALVLAENDLIEPAHLQMEHAPGGTGQDGALESRVRDVEEAAIAQALASCNGRRKEAARALGISERTLRYKLQKLREREELVQ